MQKYRQTLGSQPTGDFHAQKPSEKRSKLVVKILTIFSIQLLNIEKCQLFTYVLLSNENTTVYVHITQIKPTTD